MCGDYAAHWYNSEFLSELCHRLERSDQWLLDFLIDLKFFEKDNSSGIVVTVYDSVPMNLIMPMNTIQRRTQPLKHIARGKSDI
jgi:hypothetical protein